MCDLENPKNEDAMIRVGSQRHSKKKFQLSLQRNDSRYTPIFTKPVPLHGPA